MAIALVGEVVYHCPQGKARVLENTQDLEVNYRHYSIICCCSLCLKNGENLGAWVNLMSYCKSQWQAEELRGQLAFGGREVDHSCFLFAQMFTHANV